MRYIYKMVVDEEKEKSIWFWGASLQYSTEWKKAGAGWNRLVLLLAFL